MAERLILTLMAICTVGVAWVTGDCGPPPQLENGSPKDEFISQTSFPVGTTIIYKCYEGYVFQEGGSSRIICRDNSTWSPLRAVCEPKNCGNPGELLNGYFVAMDTTFGNNATFYCDEGYQIVGRNYRRCTANGWDGQVPTCEIVTCADPPPINNGTLSSLPEGGSWKFGAVATYTCDKDYSLIGDKNIVCTATGEWDKDPPMCKVVQCQRPEVPRNGEVVAGFGPTYGYRDEITYKCNDGFKMVGNSVIECSENNTFVPPPPTCEPRDCGSPPQLENGSPNDEFISQTSFPVGTNITYKCYEGYVFQEGSSRLITCMANSTWSPLRAVCEPKNCGNPGELLNGYFVAMDTTFGNNATFYCDEGYQIVGRNYRRCTANGWDGQVPTCEIVTCADPPRINNGTLSSLPEGGSWKFGAVATYTCDKDYSLIGDKNIVCTATGEWDKDPPMCKVVQCQRPEVPRNGEVVAGFGPTYGYRDEITYKCNDGFKMVGNSVIECSENNTFVPPPPTCEPRDCGSPPQLENGSPNDEFISQTSFPVGTNITYKCYEGYVFQEGGSRLITCMANSTWSPLRAVCEPKNCGNPGELLNGYFVAIDTTFGNNATFYCDEGYQIVGRNYRRCTANGWDGQVPTCEIVTCADPPPINNGTLSSLPEGGSWKFGAVATYTCDKDYSLIGDKNIVCTATGEWDKDPPMCKVVQCQRPEVPRNGQVLAGFGPTFGYLDKITYKCNDGFKMVGNSVIECRENNTFVPPPPTCEPPNGGSGGRSVDQQSKLLLILGAIVFLMS
ncbi:zona pellucida sperm-binding protein 3 receptor-like [Heterodontus francisci]|uniref:zona pellucida sperm-binding protein 3 receptor-like n=1 Tax=Heterodontus francisci TaxID=7792 RepID=UPI00355B4259